MREAYTEIELKLIEMVKVGNITESAHLIVNKKIGVDIQLQSYSLVNFAAYYNQPLLMQFLIEKGADFNQPCDKGFTPLITAASRNHLSCVETLVEANCLLNEVTHEGFSALMFAAYNQNESIATTLVEAGADLQQTLPGGETVLDLAALRGSTPLLYYFSKRGAKRSF